MDLRRLHPFATAHHGLVTRDAAAEAGVSRSAWYRALDAGRLDPLGPGVARLPGAPVTREQRILAAVWSAGPGALASHRSAAHLWGVARPADDPVDLIIPQRTRRAPDVDAVVHRPRDVVELHPVLRRNIPAVRPGRLLVDLGAVDPRGVEPALTQLIASRVITYAGAVEALDRHAERGHHGITALRHALDRWLLHERVPDAVLASTMATFLRNHRLPPATFHARVAGFEVDFLFDDSIVVIECDGWGVHGLDRGRFEDDRIRNPAILAEGFVITPVTWLQLTRHPADTAERMRHVLGRWAPQLLAPRRPPSGGGS